MRNYLLTSESMTEGHPDKMADQIADAILDEVLRQDKYGRVACEVGVGMGYVIVGGEITTNAWVNVSEVVRRVIKDIGYDKPEYGFDYRTVAVFNTIHEQSADIARGVRRTASENQGAGDQGLMVGYACRETPELMPLPIMLAHKLAKRLAEVRKKKMLSWLRPDGKTQVSVEYRNGRPAGLSSVVIAAHHDPGVSLWKLRKGILEKVVKPVCRPYFSRHTEFYINNTGRFVIGGPVADCGQTGRKIIADTYGGVGSHGGGAFSGKDSTKVDRSASYMARYIAKNIVAAGIADKCEIRLSYVIGGIKPISFDINLFESSEVSEDRLRKIIPRIFDLSPGGIIRQLRLLRPIYRKTSCYGHFGRTEPEFTWERIDKVKNILRLI